MTRTSPSSRRLVTAFAACLLLAGCTSSKQPTAAGGAASSRRASRGSAAKSAGVVVAAAGDVACDPADGAYNAGAGMPTACQALATSNLLSALKPAAVFALGDLQYEVGTLAAYEASYDASWGRFKGITYPAPGNHEYGTGVTRGYFEYFGARAGPAGRGYYSTNVAGWHVISLNSNCAQITGCESGSDQEKWLRDDLAKHPVGCTLAFWHQGRWSSGLHGSSDKMDGLWRTLAAAGADVVLTAHDHDYERFAPLDANGAVDPARGMREFVVGTGGRSLYPVVGAVAGSEVRNSGTFGVLQLTLQPTAYSWKFVPVPGSTFTDSGSGSCH